MKRKLIAIAGILLLMTACGESIEEKPPKLIPRDRMVSMLVDIHLAQAIYQTRRYSNEELSKYSESDFYYSILKKYKVADSTFEQSMIYYSGKPKEFEKIYTRILNRFNEMEQELAQKNQQPVDIGN